MSQENVEAARSVTSTTQQAKTSRVYTTPGSSFQDSRTCTTRASVYPQTCLVWPLLAPVQVFSVPGASRLPRWDSVNLGLLLVGSSTVLHPGSPASQGGASANAVPVGTATPVAARAVDATNSAMRLFHE
jgi:hypothetical protein